MLSTPAAVMARLDEIDQDLAERQHDYETAALDWFRAKREREKERALVFLQSTGTIAERHAQADFRTARLGREEEAQFEALKAVIRVLETRASIGQSILRAQGRT